MKRWVSILAVPMRFGGVPMDDSKLFTDSRRFISVVAVAAVICSAGGGAMAEETADAWLTQVQGTVLVDDGGGFVAVQEDTELEFGNRIVVSDGGYAVLSYGGECTVPLESPSMTTVSASACVVSTQGENGGEGSGSGSGSGSGTAIAIAAAAAAAGLLTWCLVDWCEDDEDPSSP